MNFEVRVHIPILICSSISSRASGISFFKIQLLIWKLHIILTISTSQSCGESKIKWCPESSKSLINISHYGVTIRASSISVLSTTVDLIPSSLLAEIMNSIKSYWMTECQTECLNDWQGNLGQPIQPNLNLYVCINMGKGFIMKMKRDCICVNVWHKAFVIVLKITTVINYVCLD